MTDIPDWKKAIDRGTSMHTILAEKKSAEGPDWMKTPEEEEMLWEVRKFAVDTFGKTKWNDKVDFYLKVLNNICFSDYIDRITFQKQIWIFNEMSSLIKTFQNTLRKNTSKKFW